MATEDREASQSTLSCGLRSTAELFALMQAEKHSSTEFTHPQVETKAILLTRLQAEKHRSDDCSPPV